MSRTKNNWNNIDILERLALIVICFCAMLSMAFLVLRILFLWKASPIAWNILLGTSMVGQGLFWWKKFRIVTVISLCVAISIFSLCFIM